MRKALSVLLAMALLLAACGGDNAADEDSLLTAAEREWCNFADASEESAQRFDLIFEAGLALDLNMDLVNFFASEARDKYEAEGLDADAAVRAVSDDMAKNPDFAAACKLAYAENQ